MNNPQAVLEEIAKVRKLRQQQDILLCTLEMQALVALQGIDPEDVLAYTYDPKLDKRKSKGLFFHALESWRKRNPVYNVVVMKGGIRLEIQPVPVPPKGEPDEAAGTTA